MSNIEWERTADRNARALPALAPAGLLAGMPVNSLVVFRALQLGDMLCAVPALRALRAALPHAHITLVGLPWAAQFAARFKQYVDDFLPFPGHPDLPEQPANPEQLQRFHAQVRARGYDLALQLHGSGTRSNCIVAAFQAKAMAGYAPQPSAGMEEGHFFPYPEHGTEAARLLRLVTQLGAPAQGEHLEFPLTQADHQELQASQVAVALAPGSYLCIHPGARMRDKCWPPQQFAAVADQLAQAFQLQVVLTGSEKERDLTQAVAACMHAPAIDTAGPLSIGAMAALMQGARLLICNDTGVSHIAAGLRLPSVVIFSKADIQRWAPADQARHRCLWDPAGARAADVLEQGRQLLASHPPEPRLRSAC